MDEADRPRLSILDPCLDGDEVEADNIYNLSLACKHGFEEYLRQPRLFNEQVAEFQRRFLTWAGYLGVFADVSICLDTRLAGSPEMKELFLSMLKVLRRNLERGIRRHHALNDQVHIDVSSLASDGVVIGITGSIDRLSRLAFVTRTSGNTDQVERVRRWSQNQKPDGFAEVILAMLKHRFSSETFEMAESLQVQLASSIVYRRNRLLYQTRHEKKLRADRNEDIHSQSAPTAIQETAFQKALETIHEGQPEQLLSHVGQLPQQSGPWAESSLRTNSAAQYHQGKKSSAASVHSMNPHIAAQYPKRPQTETCELCGKELPREVLKYEKLWRTHVNEDLEPYVCVSQECGSLPPAFASRQKWRSHMDSKHGVEWSQQIHRPWEWYCPLEESTTPPFSSEQVLLEHINRTHSRDLPHSDIALLCSRSKLPKLLGADVCPFCGDPPPPITKETESVYHAWPPGSSAGQPRPPARSNSVESKDSSPIDRPPPGDTTTILDHEANNPARTESLSARMSKHVAEHLESIALWSLLWNGDNSSAASGASAKTVRDTNFDSDGEEIEVEVDAIDQTEIPDCPPIDWSIVPSLVYNGSLPEKEILQAREIPFLENNGTLDNEAEVEVSRMIPTEVLDHSTSNRSTGPTLGQDESLLDSAIPGTTATTLAENTESLGDELREAYCETGSKQRSEFLPIDALDRIVTDRRVREEIGKFSGIPNDELDRLVQHVLDASTIPGQTSSRKKIFAILALIDKPEAIWDFISEDIYDIHLPFEKEKIQNADGKRKGRYELSRKSDTYGSTRIPIRATRGWTGAEVTNFERTQWDIHVPIFFLNTKKDPKVRHYPLQESIILPFIEDDEVKQGGKMGGFADVWRVKIHPAHHNQGFLDSGKRENPSFAIKRLRYMDQKAFRKEVQNLKRFSSRDYLHLIKLLGTYEWRHQYYLVFPWADGNLLDFWERHPEPLARKRDIAAALWLSERCIGLVEGMKMIHTWDMPDVGEHDHVFTFPTSQIHGLHGDVKPENILWFKQHNENAEPNSSSLGQFKISDFGLSHFHGTRSIRSIDAKDTGFSPTYRAPERDMKGKVTQSYDVWSLACVLLEFATWYVGGYEGVKTFGQKRVEEDTQYDGGFKQDRFFNFMRVSQGVTDDIDSRAQICSVEKVSVAQQFDRLYDDPHCSDYLVDFLELIQTSLLRLEPDKRRSCEEIAESLQNFHVKLQNNPSYGTHRVEIPPSRSPTLDSVLMEDDDISDEFKRQIRKSLPRRSISFNRETAYNSTLVPAVVFSSPNSSHVNLVPSTARIPRPSSPELRARARLSTNLTTVQESPGTQALEALDKELQHLSISGSQAEFTSEQLKAPSDGGKGRSFPESVTMFRDGSDAGQEDVHDRHVRKISQTGSQGRENSAKRTSTTESVMEDERPRNRWFKSILKRIPGFD